MRNDIKTAFCNGGKRGEDTSDYASLNERMTAFSGFTSYATPGHKGALNALDITEYDEDRLFPGKQVEKAENTVARHYGVKKLRFSTGGSSQAIKAAVLAVNSDIIAPQFSHRCLFEGAKLARVTVHTFDSPVMSDGLPKVPTASDYIAAINDLGEKAQGLPLFVTSPDYFGRVADIEGIKRLCDDEGRLLIVDAAHGAHFASSDILPNGGERLADFACMSAHKTLRAYTQSAYAVCNNERYYDKFDEALTNLGTSSPSYLLLDSLESAVTFERDNARKYAQLASEIESIKRDVECLANDDVMRLVVKCDDGERAYNELVKNGVIAETYYGNYVIFIITLSNQASELRALKEILLQIL